MLPATEILPALDFNVLLMIGGTMGLVQLFIDSRMPERMADMIMEHVPNVQWAAVSLSLFAGVISAFVDNVATVLMVAPVAIEICRKLNTNPVPFIISIAVSSNLQGAATLVGDTTAIMLGSALNMSIFDFIWYNGKPGMCFMVELGAVLSALIGWFILRKEKVAIPSTGKRTEVRDYVPTVLLFGAIGLLILASFAPEGWNLPDETNGLICFALLLPVVVRVLYTEHFLCVLQMVLCSLFYMYFKAIYTPIAYFSLAKGDSVVYFVMETAYSLVFAACVMVGYRYGNLNGAGFGLVAANLFDLLALYAVYSRRYGFRFESLTLRHCFLQGALLMAGLVAAWQPVRIVKFPIGLTLLALSAFISWRLLTRKSSAQANQ